MPDTIILTHCGRDFHQKDIALILEIARRYQDLGHRELISTICENLSWYTACTSRIAISEKNIKCEL